MKNKHPIFLFSEIDEKYIEEANPENSMGISSRRRFFTMLAAAALCIVLTASLVLFFVFNKGDIPISEPTEGDGQLQGDNDVYSLKEYGEIAKAFGNIYATPPAENEEASNTDNYNQYIFRSSHYFTLPYNNNPYSGTKGNRDIIVDNYCFNSMQDGVKISAIEGASKKELLRFNISYADPSDKYNFIVDALHITEDRETLIVVLNDLFSRTAIVSFDISGFESGKAATQKSFVTVSGKYKESSYIDGKLIFATTQAIEKEAFNADAPSTFMPYTEVNGKTEYADLANIYLAPNADRAVYTTLAQFDVKQDKLLNTKSVIGGHDPHITGSAVYLEKSYTVGEEATRPNKSELWRFAYGSEGLSNAKYYSIDGVVYDGMLNEHNGVLQVLNNRGVFYCLDADSGALLSELETGWGGYYYQAVRFEGDKVYLGHYCQGNSDACNMEIEADSLGMLVWTLEADISNPESITTSTPKHPYGSLLDFGDGYWLALKYQHVITGESYKLSVSVLKESESGMIEVDSTVFDNRKLEYFPPHSIRGVVIDNDYYDYYYDKENRLFGTLMTAEDGVGQSEYMLWQFDAESETLTVTQMETNKHHENIGGYYLNGYFFTVSIAGDLATRLEK